jgi:methylase of polypeptide subunit release factors
MTPPVSEKLLVGLAKALGAELVPGFSSQERQLLKSADSPDSTTVSVIRRQIESGTDALGELFCELRDAAARRPLGATYTPLPIVTAMLAWGQANAAPSQIVDPGLGSGRFLVRAAKTFPNASLVGVELDPLAALLARATIATLGLSDRAQVLVGDYREVTLPKADGQQLFIGNPPYVRHHLLGAKWKEWLTAQARKRGLSASQLAGLHVYFFLATLNYAKAGDVGAFITAGEWLDVNYGQVLRDLFVGELGGRELVILEPTAQPFPDAATTAAISYFTVQKKQPFVFVSRVPTLKQLRSAKPKKLRRERLEAEMRWSVLTRTSTVDTTGLVELGELCRVHRGQVTGANKVWIIEQNTNALPASVLFPSVTRAKELIGAGTALNDGKLLKAVIDIPAELERLSKLDRSLVEKYLRKAKALGAHLGYVARTRKAWWSVGLREPAPILATYMARRAPAFVRNLAEARHVNIAHGLYPRDPLSEAQLKGLLSFLRTRIAVSDGRTYAGGLTKFEPREMERLLVPEPHLLASYVPTT